MGAPVAEAIRIRLRQAELHLAKLRANQDPEEIELAFQPLLASLRSVVMYVESAAVTSRAAGATAKELKASENREKDAFWKRVATWATGLPADERLAWDVLRDLRNDDIHEFLVVPTTRPENPFWGAHFPPGWFGRLFGEERVVGRVQHAAGFFNVVALCERALAVARKIEADHVQLL